MKNINNKSVLLIAFLVTFSIPFIGGNIKIQSVTDNEINQGVHTSEIERVEVAPFNIWSNSVWANLASNKLWCSGSGTQSDPYIIEGIIIDGTDKPYIFSIYSSNVFFVIRNSVFINNKGFNRDGVSIMIRYTSNGVFENNTIRNTAGLRCVFNSNLIIRGNIFDNNTGFEESVHHQSLRHQGQIEIWGGNNIAVYENMFIGESLPTWGTPLRWRNPHTKDHYSDDIFWDSGTIGNYWSDYPGADMDGDGIGDIFYLVISQYGNRDNFPICNREYISPPEEWMEFITRFLQSYFVTPPSDPSLFDWPQIIKPLNILTQAGNKFEEGMYFDAFDRIRNSIEFLLIIPEELGVGSYPHDVAIQNVFEYLMYLVKFIVDDAMENTVGNVGEDDKFIIRAMDYYDTALMMLDLEDYGEAVRFFKHSYRNIMKARGELIIESFIDDLLDQIEKIQELMTGDIPNEALNYLEQAENKLLLAIEKANASLLSQSLYQLKDVVKNLLDTEIYGVDTIDIIESILQNADDLTYLKIVEAESILMGESNKHIDKAWINYNKAIDLWNAGNYEFALSYFAKAIEKINDALI